MKFSELGDNGPQFKLDELTGWTQAAPKRATPQPKKPTYAELIKKSDDKRSALQRQKDGGKKNWFAEEELEEASWINGVKQDDKELVWKQTSMSYEKAVEQYGKEHVKLGGKNKLGQQTVQVHVPLVAEGSLEEIDRRGFLKGLGAAATLAAAPSLAKAGQQLNKQPNFQEITKQIKEIFAKNIKLPANFQQPTSAGKFGFKFNLNGKLVGKKVLDSCGSAEIDKAVMDSATNIPITLVKQWNPEENKLNAVTVGFGVGDGWWKAAVPAQTKSQPQSTQQNVVTSPKLDIELVLKKAKKAIINDLIDPDSVKMKDIILYDTASKSGEEVYLFVCKLNARNRMGGYTGFKLAGVPILKSTGKAGEVVTDSNRSGYEGIFFNLYFGNAIKNGKVIYKDIEESAEQGVAEGQYQSQYKSKEDAIAYAKDKAKTFRDPEDGIEIWSMPDGGFDAVHTMNSNGRNHCVANGGKKLGTIGPRQQGVAEGDLDEASLAQMRDYFGKDNADSVQVNRNYDTPSRKKNPAGIPPEIQTLVNKMYHAGKITPQEFEVLRKFQRQTKINVGIREADANPYAIGMSQAMKSTGDKPPLKKSTINKAHAIARSIKKGE